MTDSPEVASGSIRGRLGPENPILPSNLSLHNFTDARFEALETCAVSKRHVTTVYIAGTATNKRHANRNHGRDATLITSC